MWFDARKGIFAEQPQIGVDPPRHLPPRSGWAVDLGADDGAALEIEVCGSESGTESSTSRSVSSPSGGFFSSTQSGPRPSTAARMMSIDQGWLDADRQQSTAPGEGEVAEGDPAAVPGP